MSLLRRLACWIAGHDRASLHFARLFNREFSVRYRAKTGESMTVRVRCADCGAYLS